MQFVIFVLLIILYVALCIYLIYGTLRKDFGIRYYRLVKKTFPSFLIWPKREETYVLYYKVTVFCALILGTPLIAVSLYVILIKQ